MPCYNEDMVYAITVLAIFHFQYWLFLTKIKSKTAIYWLYIWATEILIGGFVRPLIPYWFGLLAALFIYDCIILFTGNDRDVKDGEYLLVLGFGLKNNQPSATLKGRLNKAIEYAEKHPDIQIVVTGGMTGGEISEAEAMKEYLLEKGIDENRILLEEESTTTIENFQFMKRKYPQLLDASCIIVSSEYHLFRSKQIAKREGYKNIRAIASHTDSRILLTQLLKEKYLIIKEMKG